MEPNPRNCERILDHPLFAGVSPERVAGTVARLRPLHVKRGTLLVGPSRHSPTYLVLRGVLHPFVLTGDGRRLVLEMVGVGSYDGLLMASGHDGHLCEAATDAVVVPVTMDTLFELIAAEPAIAVNLLNLTLSRLERREAHMLGMVHGEVLCRVAHQLAAIGRYAGIPDGDWIELSPRPTHQTLSDMIGVRRETVSLQLGTLRRVGAVEIRPHTMRLNTAMLLRIADHQYPRAISSSRRECAS